VPTADPGVSSASRIGVVIFDARTGDPLSVTGRRNQSSRQSRYLLVLGRELPSLFLLGDEEAAHAHAPVTDRRVLQSPRTTAPACSMRAART
jgi:hypothetical protein